MCDHAARRRLRGLPLDPAASLPIGGCGLLQLARIRDFLLDLAALSSSCICWILYTRIRDLACRNDRRGDASLARARARGIWSQQQDGDAKRQDHVQGQGNPHRSILEQFIHGGYFPYPFLPFFDPTPAS
jgi:hypothetical protein